jgi:hypothetical protein
MAARPSSAVMVLVTAAALTCAACSGDDGTAAPTTTTSTAIATATATATTASATTSAETASIDPTASAPELSEATSPMVPNGSGAVIDPGDGGTYAPTIDAAAFSATVDNPYFPLRPASRWVYSVTSSDGDEQIVVEVMPETRTVVGVPVVQVHDVASSGGTTKEDTIDYYSQHRDGSVWYFGEATTAYDGATTSTRGSWEAGVDGALPGIIMPAAPAPGGRGYRQEYYPGQTEDLGQIIATGQTIDGLAGHFDRVVVTRDWSPLEPDLVEEKSYAPGVGVVLERTKQGGDEVVTLTDYTAG